jgi:AbiV family abortive infection protein
MKDRQYNQKLTPKSASKGIKAAIENSKSLLEDAILLFENGRYERTVALSILSIEEAGKPSILRAILLEDAPKQLKIEWRNYRKHIEKNVQWILPGLVKEGARHIEQMRRVFDEHSEHGLVLENLKQLAFYTDAFSKCKWSTPNEAINKELAEEILSIAKILVVKDEFVMITEAELKLWVKYLKPVWKHEMHKMKQALINCYQEAEELGLIKKGVTKEMVDFLL